MKRSVGLSIVMFFAILICLGCKKNKNMNSVINHGWLVESILSHPDSLYQKVLNDEVYVLEFENKHNYAINLDINRGGGMVTFKKRKRISFETPSLTEACCDSPYSLKMLDIMLRSSEYEVNSETLILKTESGKEVVFVKKY
jgi:heat shock protein HslJ